MPTAPTLHVQHASIGDGYLAYATVGEAAAPPLLLLNGTASPMNDWDPAFLDRLASDGHRVIVFDYPGLGSSSAIADGTTFDDLADDTAAFVHALGYDAVDVLGWSMGGFIAQRLLVAHPDVVRHAVLAATNPGGNEAVLGPKWVQRIDSHANSGLAAYVKTNYPLGMRYRGWAFINRVNDAIDAGSYPNGRVPARTERIMVTAEDPWLRSNANLDELRSVTSQVLVLDGQEDRVTPVRNSWVIARAIPPAQLFIYRRAGHSFLFQRPLAVADRIDAFLDH